jgi:outer membrane lipoprotein SlyB
VKGKMNSNRRISAAFQKEQTKKREMLHKGEVADMKPVQGKEKQQNEPGLKGTFAAVMLLGGFLIVSWLGVFILFLVRS